MGYHAEETNGVMSHTFVWMMCYSKCCTKKAVHNCRLGNIDFSFVDQRKLNVCLDWLVRLDCLTVLVQRDLASLKQACKLITAACRVDVCCDLCDSTEFQGFSVKDAEKCDDCVH